MTELWRVADRKPHTPAHVVNYLSEPVLVTECNWSPSRRGLVVTRAEMLAQNAFVCRCCVKKVMSR